MGKNARKGTVEEVSKDTVPKEVVDTSAAPVSAVHEGEHHIPHKYLIAILGVIVAAAAFFLLYDTQVKHVAIKQFTNVYSFVPEKISKSAPIQINVPDGVSEDDAREHITFSPEIKGTWQTEELEGIVIFEPKKPLRSGVYYAVNMNADSVQISGDFFVDEDPQVQSVFPAAESESHEDSEITIVFNRPMVPLTTLSAQESIELPITISPPTPGRFKWISTRNLQFIPETTLVPSSHYTVEIKEGLFSVDGLPVAPLVHSFVTRTLRYDHVTKDTIGYKTPVAITFNQPIDFEKTKNNITVENLNGDAVSIVVERGETTRYDRATRKSITETDPNKIFVYQRKDEHGRKKLWDFDTTYKVSISGAVPLVGTRNLEQGRTERFTVPTIVQNTKVKSERSSAVRTDFFDPQGTLTVSFYDEIDKNKSSISATGLKSIEYAEKCKKDNAGNTIYIGSSCDKESDLQTLIFSFHESAFGTDHAFDLELNKIYTPDGFRINAEPIQIPLKTYPTFTFLRTIPAQGASEAAVDGMYVCTNSPLKEPVEEGIGAHVQTDGYIVFGRWWSSRFLKTMHSNTKCNEGEFETRLNYGLLPETDYDISLVFEDEFGQSANQSLSIKTQAPEEQYTRFHNMQKKYNVTTPDRTKFTYAVENLEYVDMHICRLEPETFFERVIDRAERTTPPLSNGCTEVVTKNIQLPKRYWVNNYFQVNLAEHFEDTRGHYVITFSSALYGTKRNDLDIFKQLYDRTYVSVTNLAVGKKEVEYNADTWSRSQNPNRNEIRDRELSQTTNLYWINDTRTLAPAVGAVVTQFEHTEKDGLVRKTSSYTDGEGIARIEVIEDLEGAVVRRGEDTAVVVDWSDMLRDTGYARDASRSYTYTDRPIYRPGHTVHIRGLNRIGFDGTYEIREKSEIPLHVFDSQGAKVYDTMLEESAYGTFNTDFELPSDAPLGTYRIEVFGHVSRFDVEEYVPAAFKLEAESGKSEYRNGDTFTLDVQADYYFGVPLSEGTVSYSVTAQDYHFDKYTDEYFNFGRSWYDCYYCGYGDDFLFRGEVDINANGHAEIKRDIDFDDYFTEVDKEGSKIFSVFLTAKDINGRSVSMQKSFVVHKSDFYLGAKTDKYYTSLDTPLTLRVKTVDTEGASIAKRGITRALYKVEWETFKREEVDGGFYYRSEKRLEEISKENINTDGSGNWSGQLVFPKEGSYEIHVSKKDDRGNTLQTISRVYIYGTESIAVPPNNNYELDLEVENKDLDVGDTASILIKSPYDKAKVLISVERGSVYDYWVVDLVGGLYLHEFPIKSEYAPNMYVSALLLSEDPEIKYGSVRFEIGSEEHRLDVQVTSNKTHYLPGEEVTLSVETRDYTGVLVPAEVSLAVADLSVLALKGNPKKSPVQFFYDGFPLAVSTASNIKHILHEVDIPLGSKGGGGADPDDLSKKKRGIFKDTAFWEASVETDQNGKATVSFILPDNLTTWQIESLAITKDTKLGVEYNEFTTKKDLMAVPLKPRFVVPGDTFSLGAKVFNQTDSNTTVEVLLESDTLVFTKEAADSVFINAGESKTVYFEVQAPKETRDGVHAFTFTASDDTFVDSVEQVIPVTPNTTYETVATANFTKDDGAFEYLYIPDNVIAGQGGLTINANATMAVFMTDALGYMVTYPYGCSEQLASSLSTIGTLTRALTLPNVEGEFDTVEHRGVTYTVADVVEDGLARVYPAQAVSGGFAYYKGLRPNLALTMHVATALGNLKEAGYEVREDALQRAYAYIESTAKSEYILQPSIHKETVILAEYVLQTVANKKKTALTGIIKELIDDDAFLNEKISSVSLAYLSILTADNFGRTDRKHVYEALQNRIDIDGRGAYLTSGGYSNRSHYETPVKNTALLLKAFAVHEDEHPTMGNVLRWLLQSRDKDGVWGSTQNTFVVVDAMIDYLEWQRETESHFTLKGILDGVEIFGYEFSPSNIFETFTHFIAIDDFEREKLLPLEFARENHTGIQSNFYYDMALKYFLPVEALPPRDEGITITRDLYALKDIAEESPVNEAAVGDIVRGKLSITIPDVYTHVAIEDIIPAGFEIVNFNLETEDRSLLNEETYAQVENEPDGLIARAVGRIQNLFDGTSQSAQAIGSRRSGGSYGNVARTLRPTHMESHDDRVFLYIERLLPGVYEYEYFLRALVPGEFQHLPARAEELYFPEVFGRTPGDVVTVTPD